MRRKTITNRDLHTRFFLHFEQVTWTVSNLNWFLVLFAPAVIGESNYFGYLFYETQLKTALKFNESAFSVNVVPHPL